MFTFSTLSTYGSRCLRSSSISAVMLRLSASDNRASGREIAVGMGLHAGEALTGDVGSAQRKEYTVMGDVVNVASRIEQLNKTYDSHLLLSEEVRRQLPPEVGDLTDLGTVKVKGREKEVRIFRAA